MRRRAIAETQPPAPGERGSSLAEALIAIGLFSVAVVAVVQLVALSVGLHADAGESARALWHAADGLRTLEQGGARSEIGGSLEADVPGFSDQPEPGVTRRWTVAAGPVAGTHALAVRVLNQRARRVGRAVEVRSVAGAEPAP